MNINTRPGRIVPQDHLEWLISRYGYKRILLSVLKLSVVRGRLGLRRRTPRKLLAPPSTAYLRRDIGLPPEQSVRHYWDYR